MDGNPILTERLTDIYEARDECRGSAGYAGAGCRTRHRWVASVRRKTMLEQEATTK